MLLRPTMEKLCMTLRAFSDLLESFTKMDCTLLHTRAYMYNSVCFIYFIILDGPSRFKIQKERLSLSARNAKRHAESHVGLCITRRAARRVFD